MITYCTNIHPGESWDEILQNVRTHLMEVKMAVSPDTPFPVGLRLSDLASREIDEDASIQFHEWCLQHSLYVPTINGFPFGQFHSAGIKEKVYMPDWRHAERAGYTKRLATLLDTWLPAGITGSISTVPVGFRSHVSVEDYGLVKKNLLTVLEHLDRLRQKSGKEIILSLEPEPGCVLETSSDLIRFFEQMNFSDESRKCIGICYDCCHQAIQFEKASESLSILSESDIRIGKIQVSSALRIAGVFHEILPVFSEPYYLHQVVVRRQDGSLIHYKDLPDAVRDHPEGPGEEWRIHFHVPVFLDRMDVYGTTRSFTEEILSLADKGILLEVETYTWNVLPPEFRLDSITDSIVREIQWVTSHVNEKNRCS